MSVLLQDEALEAALLRTADEAGQAGAFAKDQIDAFDPGLNASTRLFANHVLPLTVLFFILAALFVLTTVGASSLEILAKRGCSGAKKYYGAATTEGAGTSELLGPGEGLPVKEEGWQLHCTKLLCES